MFDRLRQGSAFSGAVLLALSPVFPVTAVAQAPNPPVLVQPTPPVAAVERLNRNLTRLSSEPRDVEALVGAGDAAFEMNDVQAARGFYTRANLINARDVDAKIGLARVAIAMKEPEEAASWFDQAEKAGGSIGPHVGDRAFAYDMMGWSERAQRDYAVAFKADPDNKLLRRRYAVSLGITGKVAEAERMLEPLLYDSDRAAWRDRAFILAMNGREAEARKITQTVMPKPLADAIDPYMRQMAALNPAQRAAAVHFGRFPADAVRLASATSPAPPASTPATTVAAAEPAASTRNQRSASRRRGASPAVAAVPTPTPTASPVVAATSRLPEPPPYRPPVVAPTAAVVAATPAVQSPAGASGANTTPASQSVTTPVASPSAQPAVSLPPVQGPLIATATPAAVAVPPARTPAPTASAPPPQDSAPLVATAAPSSAPLRTLAEIMAAIEVPEAETASAAAVDLTEIARVQAERRKADAAIKAKAEAERLKKEAAAKAKAEAEAKAKAEAAEKARIAANPQRYWVQIAAGRSNSALAFDLRSFKRKFPAALGKQQGWTADYGAIRRLVVGPFPNLNRAKAIEAELKAGGSDAFVWRSDAGEDVVRLDGS